MGAFESIAATMADMGVFGFFFPWLLTLAVSYGILDQYEVVSSDDTVNGVTALSIAFFVIGAAYTTLGTGVFLEFAGALAFGIFGIIGFVILLGVSGYDLEDLQEAEGSLPYVAAILIFIVAFGGTLLTQTEFFAGVGELIRGSGQGSEIFSQFLVLLFLTVVIIFVSKMGEEG